MSKDLNHEDMVALYLQQRAELARDELAKGSDLISRFAGFAAAQGLTLTPASFEYIQTIGIVANARGLAKALLGPITTERDGLLSYEKITERLRPSRFQEGYFMGRDFGLMAHPYYRRGMHPNNNWAPRFLQKLCSFDHPNVQKYIAIDEDRVRISIDEPAYFEADTWYGAPFKDDVREIKSCLVKLGPPQDIDASHISFFFADVYCTDIKWSESAGIKTFQSLELKTEDVIMQVDGNVYFPARYLHAEFDMTQNCFRHFDGAVQLFSEDEYYQRRDADFNMTAKNVEHIKARSKKIFKFNGPIMTDTWVDLCCHFYAANPILYKYFNKSYPEHTEDVLAKIRALKGSA
jgi:hypothetical protein